MQHNMGSATHTIPVTFPWYIEVGGHVKLFASTGSRTRVDCLEGNHASRYTTDAGEAITE